MIPAPIVLFVYNRPEHTLRTLEALASNDLVDHSVLYVFSDGPKTWTGPEDALQVAAVRDVVRSRKWCREVVLKESVYNRGLATSIVAGVTEIVRRHGRAIVLEDDILTRPGFLRYMNNALEMYENDDGVMHVSGMIFGTPRTSRASTTAFLKVLSCNGWGTWRRAWDHYTNDIDVLFARIRERGIGRYGFDIEGSATFYSQLVANREGRINTWAVRWYASWLTAGGISLFPKRSLLTNIGHDSTGTHAPSSFYEGETVESLEVSRIPIQEDLVLRREVARIWRKGTTEIHRRQPPAFRETTRKRIRQMLNPFRTIGRRTLRFVFPEVTVLDREHANFAIAPNCLINTKFAQFTKIYPPYRVRDASVGEYTYIERGSRISQARIGKFCSIGPNFVCGGGVHPTDGLSTSPMFYSTRKQNGVSLCNFDKFQELKPVVIGNDVFIGVNVTVLDGVTIGDGAVIGAGCIVSKDVPPYAIVVGNPMRVFRYRFSEETIKQLLEIAWWDWPEVELKKIEEGFFDIEGFVARYGKQTKN